MVGNEPRRIIFSTEFHFQAPAAAGVAENLVLKHISAAETLTPVKWPRPGLRGPSYAAAGECAECARQGKVLCAGFPADRRQSPGYNFLMSRDRAVPFFAFDL